METKIIDGKEIAQKLRGDIAVEVMKLKEDGVEPGLAVVLVGGDPASEIYVRNKGKLAKEVGMNSYEFRFDELVDEEEVLKKIEELNNDPKVHGILVQLPLPKHIDVNKVINTINPAKDVDGFHVTNSGKLATGQEGFVPCTPKGCMTLLKATLENLEGKNAVVIGRSNIVGKPMAQLLLNANCTVTIAHSKTKNLPELLKNADIIIAATGKPEMIKGEWLKEGAVVIDVGINRMMVGDGDIKLVGDVDFASVQGIASVITPVPGGVGPMTIATLLENTLRAAKAAPRII